MRVGGRWIGRGWGEARCVCEVLFELDIGIDWGSVGQPEAFFCHLVSCHHTRLRSCWSLEGTVCFERRNRISTPRFPRITAIFLDLAIFYEPRSSELALTFLLSLASTHNFPPVRPDPYRLGERDDPLQPESNRHHRFLRPYHPSLVAACLRRIREPLARPCWPTQGLRAESCLGETTVTPLLWSAGQTGLDLGHQCRQPGHAGVEYRSQQDR